jgi:N utilization substance protein B
LFIGKVGEASEAEAQIKAAKFLPSEEDKKHSNKLFTAPTIRFFSKNEDFRKLIKHEKLNHFEDEEMVRLIFKTLKNTETYRNYLLDEDRSLTQDRRMAAFIFEQIMFENEAFDDHLEDLFPVWADDWRVVKIMVTKTLKKIDPERSNQITTFKKILPDETQEFADLLLDKTLEKKDEFDVYIQDKLQNWELSRVSLMDNLLMRMAICEMIWFPTIPTKVTINEYIDISKLYSTPKSKEFINGILDRVLRQLKEEGKIKKAGRGLVGEEN